MSLRLCYLSSLSLVFGDLSENLQTSSVKPETGPGVLVAERHTVLFQHPD